MYLSSDEFLDLERARLTLRAHGIGADRGRLVREALALLMTDLEAGIDASMIAKRLRAAGEPDPADGAPAGGVLVGAGPANGTSVDSGFVNGVLAGGSSVNDGLASGDLVVGDLVVGDLVVCDRVVGVLANGIGVTGPPEGPQ